MQTLHTLKVGDTLNNGEFRIEQRIGEGGFGITYLATEINMLENKQEQVVIKEFFMSGCFRNGTTVSTGSLNPHNFDKFKNAFLDEARLLYKFQKHPNIVNVRKFFHENGTAYFAMDYISGGNLEEYAQSQPKDRISEAEAIDLLRQMTAALSELHAQNYTHRDIKPQNILRYASAHQTIYVLIDFGIARDFIADETAVTSTIVKSEGYTPPEQYRNNAHRGAFTDIYGLGATLYRLLTGQKPFNAFDRLNANDDDDVLMPEPKDLNPAISDSMNRAIMKALALKSADRFQSVADFLAAISGNDSEEGQGVGQKGQNDKTQIDKGNDDKTQVDNSFQTVEKVETTPTLPQEPNRTPIYIGIGAFFLLLIILFVWQPWKSKVSATFVEPEMIEVQGGTFNMGYDPNRDGEDTYVDDAKPLHSVTVNDFKIGRYEVTQKQWFDIMGTNPSNFKNCDTCPVEQVSWEDAQRYIGELNAKTGKTYRLPTEAEWEFAARGGNKSGGYMYAGGNDLTNVGWIFENSGDKTHTVGTKSPNELGIYDMSGNVWEWCSDWHENYPTSAQTNPKGSNSGINRVFRGGSWNFNAVYLSVAFRHYNTPTASHIHLGFRLVLGL